jgi:hypothetical protein
MTYDDKPNIWVMGQVGAIDAGPVGAATMRMLTNSYDPGTGNLLSVSRFGVMDKSRTFNGDGTVSTISDGRGKTITLTNNKLGIPRRIDYPDGGFELADVANDGTVGSITDTVGSVTRFGYDAMQRLNAISFDAKAGELYGTEQRYRYARLTPRSSISMVVTGARMSLPERVGPVLTWTLSGDPDMSGPTRTAMLIPRRSSRQISIMAAGRPLPHTRVAITTLTSVKAFTAVTMHSAGRWRWSPTASSAR